MDANEVIIHPVDPKVASDNLSKANDHRAYIDIALSLVEAQHPSQADLVNTEFIVSKDRGYYE